MKVIYTSDLAEKITKKQKETINLDNSTQIKSIINIFSKKYPKLIQAIKNQNIVLLHNCELIDIDSNKKINNKDTIEFASVIMGG